MSVTAPSGQAGVKVRAKLNVPGKSDALARATYEPYHHILIQFMSQIGHTPKKPI